MKRKPQRADRRDGGQRRGDPISPRDAGGRQTFQRRRGRSGFAGCRAAGCSMRRARRTSFQAAPSATPAARSINSKHSTGSMRRCSMHRFRRPGAARRTARSPPRPSRWFQPTSASIICAIGTGTVSVDRLDRIVDRFQKDRRRRERIRLRCASAEARRSCTIRSTRQALAEMLVGISRTLRRSARTPSSAI